MSAALLLTALFNGAWQGAVLCAAAYLVLRTQRRLNATTMFAVWSMLLVITLALPVGNYIFAARPYTVHVTRVSTVAPEPAPAKHLAPMKAYAPLQVRTQVYVAPAPSFVDRMTAALTWVLDRAQFVLIALLAVAALRLAVLARDLAGMFAARRGARRIDLPFTPRGEIRRQYAFAASRELTSPCVLGFSPALIVLPEELLNAPEHELVSVVLHEREHVRRYDDVQNVLHRIVGAVAFFCPGVRIALRELALYREQICDDAAVNGTGDAVSYAMTLTGMAQWAQGRGVPVPSLIFKRKQLMHRLEMLLDGAVNHSLNMNRRFALAAATAVVLAAAIVLRVQVPVIAKAMENPAAPHKPAKVHAAAKPAHVSPAKPAVAPEPTVKPKAPEKPKPAAQLKPATAPEPMLFSPPPRKVASRAPVAPVATTVRTAVTTAVTAAVMAERATAVARVWSPQGDAAPAVAYAPTPPSKSEDLMDALQAAGLRNLTVDQLIAIRDHGVSSRLVRAAVAYFGSGVSPDALVTMADHGVSASYLEGLRAAGVTGIAPASVVMMMDHGVNSSLIHAATAYFNPAPAPADIVYLADRGVGALYLARLESAGVRGVPVSDVVRLMDHGVEGSYIVKIRRMNPRATIDDIIRLHDAGF